VNPRRTASPQRVHGDRTDRAPRDARVQRPQIERTTGPAPDCDKRDASASLLTTRCRAVESAGTATMKSVPARPSLRAARFTCATATGLLQTTWQMLRLNLEFPRCWAIANQPNGLVPAELSPGPFIVGERCAWHRAMHRQLVVHLDRLSPTDVRQTTGTPSRATDADVRSAFPHLRGRCALWLTVVVADRTRVVIRDWLRPTGAHW
jgi:hypothetical protein